MSTNQAPSTNSPIPILLLKSPSPTPPTDPYTTHLTHLTTPSSPSSASQNSHTYTAHFIPILSHTLLPDPLISLLLTHLSPPSPLFKYGALILTSQRSVAALSSALNAPPILPHKEKLAQLRLGLYTVGPATAKGVQEIRDKFLPGCEIYGGAGAGSGLVLARLMLGDGVEGYHVRNDDGKGLKPVLFLTGETRRDVLPRMLMDEGLGEGRVQVDEMVVYQTRELEEFEFCFKAVLGRTGEKGGRWVVVFSPTAGKGMLRGLGWLDEGTGRVRGTIGERNTFVACIGPTTREYLDREFGFEADVVAEKPSPQGVRDGIERFMREKGI